MAGFVHIWPKVGLKLLIHFDDLTWTHAVHVRLSKSGHYQLQLASKTRVFPDIHTMKQGRWPHNDQWKAVYTVQKSIFMVHIHGSSEMCHDCTERQSSPEKIQWGERVLAERAETSKFLRLNKSVIGCSEEWGY